MSATSSLTINYIQKVRACEELAETSQKWARLYEIAIL